MENANDTQNITNIGNEVLADVSNSEAEVCDYNPDNDRDPVYYENGYFRTA